MSSASRPLVYINAALPLQLNYITISTLFDHQSTSDMAPTVPTLSLEAVLQALHSAEGASPYPLREIQFYARDLATKVIASQDLMCTVYIHQGELLQKRWLRMRQKQRRELLTRAWPVMPEYHRPEVFKDDGYNPYAMPSGVPPASWLWPYMNLKTCRTRGLCLFC